MNGELTALFVKNIKKPGTYSDKNRSGLRLRVKPDGRKHWVQRFSIQGRTREAGLGSYPCVTLAEARNQALENKRMVFRGIDPIEEKRKRDRMLTFSEAVDEYLGVKIKEFRSEKHKKQWRSSIDAYATPIIGKIPIQNIGIDHVLQVLRPIWETKNPTAKRVRQRLEAILSWATVRGGAKGPTPQHGKGTLLRRCPSPVRLAGRSIMRRLRSKTLPGFGQSCRNERAWGRMRFVFSV